MTGRQERTADADGTSWLRVLQCNISIRSLHSPSSCSHCNLHFISGSRISKVFYFLFIMLSQMATLTVIPYKPPRSVIRKPSCKRVTVQSSSFKNLRFDFTDVPIEKLQSSGGTGGSNLQQEAAKENRTQGMCSDFICHSVRLCLMLSDSLDHREARLR